MTILPENFLNCMSPEDRAALGPGNQTRSEAQLRWQKTEERKMHDEFMRWLSLHRDELYFDHSRMDRATSNRVGHPDFAIQHKGRVLNIEMKAEGGKLSEAQREVHAWLEKTGTIPHVCYSAAHAIQLTKEAFGV